MNRPVSLRRQSDFARLRRHGRRISTKSLTVYLADARADDPRSLVGITVSKSVGKAVVRNKLRRRLRAIASELLTSRDAVRLLVVPRPAAADLSFAGLRTELAAAFGRALA